ncbi:MAG: UvrD-helicase domain-containing protein [Planctomycetota bacterium]|jgi:ATP-dependent helicase/nuclease subunit A
MTAAIGSDAKAQGQPRLTDDQRRALDRSRSVAVTAGAGSGKTTVLVERYLGLITQPGPRGEAPLRPREVLAITYTRKAAAEMRARVRRELARRAERDPELRALEAEVVGAPISTVHAFAAQLLRAHALEAGLDPAFEMLTPLESTELLLASYDELVLPARGPGRQRSSATLRRALETAAGLFSRERLRSALFMLLGKRILAVRWAKAMRKSTDSELLERWLGYDGRSVKTALQGSLQGAIQKIELAAIAAGSVDPDDPLAKAVRTVRDGVRRAEAAESEIEARGQLRRVVADCLATKSGEPRSFRIGSKKRWGREAHRLAETRAALGELGAELIPLLAGAVHDLDQAAIEPLRALAVLFESLLARYDTRKKQRGALDFDDLIEQTFHLLHGRRSAALRRELQKRHRSVLVDEVQDLDPLQWRILEALATDAEGRLLDTRLFLVGDAKQSIYRFRGADVSVFQGLRSSVARRNRELGTWRRAYAGPGAESGAPTPSADGQVDLADSFRTLPVPLHGLNALFDHVLAPGARGDIAFEAAPGPLTARRVPADGHAGAFDLLLAEREEGARVSKYATPEEREEAELSEVLSEGELVARWIRARLTDPSYRVSSSASSRLRAARPQDFAILLRRRTHLKLFEAALRRHGLPFTVHGGIGFYGAQEVLDVWHLLRFVCEPSTDLALLGILRSPLGGLTDSEILLIARAMGASTGARPSLWERFESVVVGPNPTGFDSLARQRLHALHVQLRTLLAHAGRIPTPDLLRAALEQTGAHAAYAVGPRGAQAAANLEKLLAIVRDLEARGNDVWGIAAQLTRLVERNEREGEADVPLAFGEEGVRILTVHASKGLEFPVVIVPGLSGELGGNRSAPLAIEELGQVHEKDGLPSLEVGLRLPDPVRDHRPQPTGLMGLLRARGGAKEEAEMRRLYYVAATRARDHLVLCGTVERGAGVPFRATTFPSWMAWTLDALQLTAETIAARRLPIRVLPGSERRAATLGLCLASDLAEGVPATSPGASEAPALEQLAAQVLDLDDVSGGALDLPMGGTISARSVITPSRWTMFRECPRKFYYATVLGIPEHPFAEPFAPAALCANDPAGKPEADAGHSASAAGAFGLGFARVRGTVFHRLLERWAARGASARVELNVETEVTRALGRLGVHDDALAARLADEGHEALHQLAASPLGEQLRAARAVLCEQRFTLALPTGRAEGTMDALVHEQDGGWHLIDWKTDRLPEASTDTEITSALLARGYDRQLRLYALGAAEALGLFAPGKAPSPWPLRASIVLTGRALAIPVSVAREDLEALRAELGRDLEAIAAGRFEPGPAPPCTACGFARGPLGEPGLGVCDAATR